MDQDKRECSRITMDVCVQFFKESVDSATQNYLEGIAVNCGLGGMFISTDHPIMEGSVIALNFLIEDETKNSSSIQVRAIVRWVQNSIQPHGMGVQFVEVKGMRKQDFVNWITNLSE